MKMQFYIKQEIECGGKLWLKLVSYSNGRGKGANGHPCDGKFFFKTSECDHRFIICLDNISGYVTSNKDTIMFCVNKCAAT